MPTDALATLGTKASAGIDPQSQNILSPALEELTIAEL